MLFLSRICFAVAICWIVCLSSAQAADRLLADDFEIPVFRGTNLAGMEMNYANFNQANGPIGDTNYPVYNEKLIDYFASKHLTAFRILFSWEGMQRNLGDPIPLTSVANYQAYFDNYKRIVDYATDKYGIHVIIEPWQADPSGGAGGPRWRGGLVGTDVSADAFADFWSKMAANFKGNYFVSYGLVNEPNHMSTMSWFATAQKAITAIRDAGSTQTIIVPGNGYTAASGWTQTYYDAAATKRSNAYGWLNANGVGQPLSDPLSKLVVAVHTYVDPDECGCDDGDPITSLTAARDHVAVTLDWATANGLKVYLGEIGLVASANPNGFTPAQAWANFIDYFNANRGPFVGFTWFAAGMPDWWHDVHAPHFAITPTNNVTYTGETINMTMIQNDF
jgi:endoglucanase